MKQILPIIIALVLHTATSPPADAGTPTVAEDPTQALIFADDDGAELDQAALAVCFETFPCEVRACPADVVLPTYANPISQAFTQDWEDRCPHVVRDYFTGRVTLRRTDIELPAGTATVGTWADHSPRLIDEPGADVFFASAGYGVRLVDEIAVADCFGDFGCGPVVACIDTVSPVLVESLEADPETRGEVWGRPLFLRWCEQVRRVGRSDLHAESIGRTFTDSVLSRPGVFPTPTPTPTATPVATSTPVSTVASSVAYEVTSEYPTIAPPVDEVSDQAATIIAGEAPSITFTG